MVFDRTGQADDFYRCGARILRESIVPDSVLPDQLVAARPHYSKINAVAVRLKNKPRRVAVVYIKTHLKQ